MAEELSKRLSSKEKLDAALGIEPGGNIDDFLDGLSVDAAKDAEGIKGIGNKVKDAIKKIDDGISQVKAEPGSEKSMLVMRDVDSSLAEVESLIMTSKSLFKHIYDSLVTTDLVDAELVGSTAKLLEAIHVNIQEFLLLYKDRQDYADKVKLMLFRM